MRRGERQAGQASVELVASLPVAFMAALIAFQLLSLGYSLSLADGAAEAGALALAAGRPAGAAARSSLPGWARGRADVTTDGGEVSVTLAAPSALEPLGVRLQVSGRAWARAPAETPR